jgi:anti-anti-sigma regulatory factor
LFGIVLAVSLRVEGDPSWWLALVIMGGCGLGLILLTLFALWRMKADNALSSASERAMFLIRLLGFDKIRSEKNKPFGGGA